VSEPAIAEWRCPLYGVGRRQVVAIGGTRLVKIAGREEGSLAVY